MTSKTQKTFNLQIYYLHCEVRDAQALNDIHTELEEKYKKKYKEIEWAVTPETEENRHYYNQY